MEVDFDMPVVIKRNKKREKYSIKKLERAIQNATREAKLSLVKGKQIAKKIAVDITKTIKRRKFIKSTDLRRRALRRLGSVSKAIVSAWRRFEKRKRK